MRPLPPPKPKSNENSSKSVASTEAYPPAAPTRPRAVQAFPTTMGACIDKLYEMRATRLEQEREVERLKGEETALKEYILTTFGEDNLEGAKGRLATAAITRVVVPQVVDWQQVYAYIRDNDAWDLMERRMARVAFRDRYEQGVAVPGAEPIEIVNLSVTKSGGRK